MKGLLPVTDAIARLATMTSHLTHLKTTACQRDCESTAHFSEVMRMYIISMSCDAITESRN